MKNTQWPARSVINENCKSWMSSGTDNLKVCLHKFVVSKYHNSLPQLLECEEPNLNTCSWGNVLSFNIS